MRVIFFGTPEFAVPTLQKLFDSSDIKVIGIVTQPDAKRGRGNQTTPSPVKAIALENNLKHNSHIPIWTPERIKKDADTLTALANSQADVFVVVAYGQILSQAILDMPKYGCINVHGSLLPKYRGAAPIQWAIANGETTLGISTMQMDAGIDTGDILLKASLEVLPEDQAETISQKLAALGANLLIETLQNLDKITPIPQDHSQYTYAPTISKELLEIDWTKSAIAIHDQIRGFYPNCYTTFRGQRLKITATEINTRIYNILNPSGTICFVEKNIGFTVSTGDGLLLIKEVQPAGKRSQTGWDFVNGSKLTNGETLS
jgi:methionyl-tRNA formyltransferase